MKNRIVLLFLVAITAMPLAAKSDLLNLGFGTQGDFLNNQNGVKMKYVSLTYIHQGGDTNGFYFQANPYFGTKLKNSYGDTLKLSEFQASSFGSNFVFGYGGDLSWGKVGLILGGGLFIDANYYSEDIFNQMTLSTGLGAGANFYFQPGDGKFLINIGLTGAWRPFTIYGSNDDADQGWMGFFGEQSNFNLNIGIGWRIGGQKTKPEEPEIAEVKVAPVMQFTKTSGATKDLEFQVGTSREYVFDKLGKPSTIFYGGNETWPADTQDANGYHVYTNLGLSFLIVGDAVNEITIINNGWAGPDGLKVGSTLTSALEVLGENYQYQDFSGKDFYKFIDPAITLEVNDSDDRISEINIRYGISVFM